MSQPSPGDAAEQYVPENLRALRERKGMSQAALAEAMRALGKRWHQTTVARIEAGQREVRFKEIVDLAAILGVTTDRFTWSGPESGERALAAMASARLRTAWRETALAAARLEDAREAAVRAAGRAAASAFPRVREAGRGIGEDIGDCTLETALAEAERIRQEDREKG